MIFVRDNYIAGIDRFGGDLLFLQGHRDQPCAHLLPKRRDRIADTRRRFSEDVDRLTEFGVFIQ